MGKTMKMQPDKYKQLVGKQPQFAGPDRLGEPVQVTNWDAHISAGHKLKHFVKIQDVPGGKKQAMINTPGQNQYFVAVKENFLQYYYVWIICLTNGSDRINWRVNTGDLDFVEWDIPEEVLVPTSQVKEEK
jgi:hypothetical protein